MLKLLVVVQLKETTLVSNALEQINVLRAFLFRLKTENLIISCTI